MKQFPNSHVFWCFFLHQKTFAVSFGSVLQGEFLGLDEEEPDSCFTMGMYYAKPVKLATTARTIETTAELCQQRCQVVEECTQFTFWPESRFKQFQG